jgi:uroporphyrinogen-III synthase|tara:strand:- start:2223 stop:2783 length:561 start_codon:yes stop_codon:yes gene_type:complete
LIDFAAVPVKELPDTDWIFFTSKNSVKYFFKQNFDLSNIKVACVGKGTYKELSKYVDYVSFIGDAVDIIETGTDFAKVVGGERCVFPVSSISKRTIQNQFLDQSNIKDIVVYSTNEQVEFRDPKANVLIFTSPSNVRAYFKKITWQPYQKIIVMGPTTAKQLVDLGMFNYLVPELTGELGLIDLLK